ncbi:hypothetical protein BLNAU_3897 [Blattamonas nauphoetae]|uniref:Uncharacterized protein n=1 Tax=Blattamonas nauphoetae TaxID=2049346 RepID=A0ABQ9YBZ1_9EUKA|nr:hypothetical protein BLNAU_3897 [Blattamonas nauphoetae]
MLILDSRLKTRRNVYSRDCWQELQIGVMKHFVSFIFFHVEGRIKLFASKNTVNAWQKDLNFELIDRLKTQLEKQHAEGLPGAVVDVFFIWIVRPHLVGPFVKQTVVLPDSTQYNHDWTCRRKRSRVNLPFNTGVVSIADLLFNVPFPLDDARLPVPTVEVKWEMNSQDFQDCFVMMRNLTVDAQYQLGMGNQPDLHFDASQRHGDEDTLSNDDSSFPFSDLEREELEEDSVLPQKHKRANSTQE